MEYIITYKAFIDSAIAESQSEFWDFIILCYSLCKKIAEEKGYTEERFLVLNMNNQALKYSHILTEKQVFRFLLADNESWYILKDFINNDNSLSIISKKICGILDAFDSAVESYFNQSVFQTTGPFGDMQGDYLLYLSETGLNRRIAVALKGDLPPTRKKSFGGYFKHIIFWSNGIVLDNLTLAAPQAPYIRIRQNGILRIAILPFDRCLISKSKDDGIPFLDVKHTSEGELYFEHIMLGTRRVLNKLIRLLKAVVNEHNPDIVIFPEYCFHESFESEFKEALRSFEKKNLSIVIAGTAWVNMNGEGTISRNNICKVFIRGSDVVLESYKVQGYYNSNGEDQDDYEGITNPGKQIVMPYLKGIGYVQIMICKDMLEFNNEPHIIDRYVERFWPSFVLTPAFSSSTTAFVTPMGELANHRAVCSVVCNCCSKAKNCTVGLAAIPIKRKCFSNSYSVEPIELKCRAGTIDERFSCNEVGSCGILYEFNFSEITNPSDSTPKKEPANIRLCSSEFAYFLYD